MLLRSVLFPRTSEKTMNETKCSCEMSDKELEGVVAAGCCHEVCGCHGCHQVCDNVSGSGYGSGYGKAAGSSGY